MPKRRPWFLFLILFVVLVAVELLCAELAYHTLGEVDRAVYWLVIALNLPVLALGFWRMPVATAGLLALALLIVPYQVVLGARLWSVQREAAQIVHYAYQEKDATGEFPQDLSGYTYGDARLSRYVQRYQPSAEAGGFVLSYRVGTVNTSHTYTPLHGWQYYPD